MANPNITAGPGRPKGLPNKATQEGREAIARLVDGNAHRLSEWLEAVAAGYVLNEDGSQTQLKNGPDPEKAFSMLQSVVEYHIPKLARTELTGESGNPLQIQVVQYGHSGPLVAQKD